MTQEQKTQRYDEALKRAREAKQNTESAVTIGILEEIFPELEESEDEKIRKDLIELINDLWAEKQGLMTDRKDYERYINLLEKQGQKPTWSEEDEVKINRIVACLENLNVADNDILLKDIDWLKSLKERIGG